LLFRGHLPKQALKKFQHGTDQRAPPQSLGTLCSGLNDAASMMSTLSQNCESLNSQVCGGCSEPTQSSTPSSNLPFYFSGDDDDHHPLIDINPSSDLPFCFLEMIIITTCTLIS
jgi:hypothetical protein